MSKYKYEIADTTREQREKYANKAETSTLGGGNYTKERENDLKNISIDDIVQSIKKRKEK